MSDPTVEEVLKQAAQLIESYGWIQGSIGGHDRGFCIIGALDEVAMGYGLVGSRLAEEAMRRVRVVTDAPDGIVHWNDYPGRTREQVLFALQSAAAWRPPTDPENTSDDDRQVEASGGAAQGE